MDFSGREGPGPGQYEPYVQGPMMAENLNIAPQDRVRHEVNIPRYHEAVSMQEEKKVRLLYSLRGSEIGDER